MLTPHPVNVMHTYLQATPEMIREGMLWYPRAFLDAQNLDPDFPERGAGVIAALSPKNGWTNNVRQARALFDHGTPRGMGGPIAKAFRIYNGEHPLDVLGGNKTLHFYNSILDHTGPYCAIDRHAFDIAVGIQTDDRTRNNALKRVGVYDSIAEIYFDVADMIGISSPQLQAIVWLVWRYARGLNRYG